MYPVNITDEDNTKLKYPFLQQEQYESVHRLADKPLILIRRSGIELTKQEIAAMAGINRKIAEREASENRKSTNSISAKE